ncbi:MAG TPA: trypsin-like peptidase domain-containing protein [Candidatus Binatia bacterium]|nr:trypsin-like peptidase domain-containing protein [Candidatus Binatia bacterium]
MENPIVEKLLVVESDETLRQNLVAALSEAGYQVSVDCREGMKSVAAFGPDAVILGANPPQLDCCDLLSEIKGSERTQNIRVLMLSPGGAAERTRGLDLGADDVLSLPYDAKEFLSRVRWQLRNKRSVEELAGRVRTAEENQSAARQVEAAVNEERKTVRVAAIVGVALLAAGLLVFLVFYRRTQQQNTRVYAAITRLQTGMLTQEKLLNRSRESAQQDPAGAAKSEKAELQKRSQDLKSQIADGSGQNVSSLQNQLSAVEGRLQHLETEGKVAQTIIQSYEPSVCLIHVVVGFRDQITGLRLRYAGLTSAGQPLTDESNNPLVAVTGNGPEVHLDVFGTGFLVSEKGRILTNHHVAEPWWDNADLKEMTSQGVEPVVAEMMAYFPGISHGIAVSTEKISPEADVALLKGSVSEPRIRDVAFADGRSAISGASVVLLGYPTGIDAILARSGEDTLQSIATATKGDPTQVMEELARRHLIRPTVTQGHIGDVLPDKIVYDAQTTSGGSGGPLFNSEGKVIGINFAMVRDFGGSNFAIPIAFGKSLMKP